MREGSKRFIGWTLWDENGEEIKHGDYSPSNHNSVRWMTRFVMWATAQGFVVVFKSQSAAKPIIENT